jgi:hypothetical protein
MVAETRLQLIRRFAANCVLAEAMESKMAQGMENRIELTTRVQPLGGLPESLSTGLSITARNAA